MFSNWGISVVYNVENNTYVTMKYVDIVPDIRAPLYLILACPDDSLASACAVQWQCGGGGGRDGVMCANNKCDSTNMQRLKSSDCSVRPMTS